MGTNFASLLAKRNNFTKKLADDDLIAKGLLADSKNLLDFAVTQEQKSSLPDTQIFSYPKNINALNETKNIITMRFRYDKTQGGNFWRTGFVTFFIYCQENQMATVHDMTRIDFLLQRIDALFQDVSNSAWTGKLTFHSMRDIFMEKDSKLACLAVTYKSAEQI